MAWLQSKPSPIQGRNAFFFTWEELPVQDTREVRSGLAGQSPAGNGLPGDWNPSTLITEQTKHTEHYSQTSPWRAYFALCSNLLKPYLGYSPDLAQPVQKGFGETGTDPVEGCQTGYPENVTYREGGGSRACQSGTEESKCGLHAAWDCLNRVTQIMELNLLNNAK